MDITGISFIIISIGVFIAVIGILVTANAYRTYDSVMPGILISLIACVIIAGGGLTPECEKHTYKAEYDRTYNGGTSVQAYTYGIEKDQKLFIPSAREIYGDCSQTRGGDAYVTLYNGKYAVGPHTEFVLDYLDGNQFEKFKNYSFGGNLFNARSYSADLGINKDTARLNSANQYGSAGIVTRTPGSSNTRARTTSISDEGGLNTACFTYGNNGLAPCFRVDKSLAKKVMIGD